MLEREIERDESELDDIEWEMEQPVIKKVKISKEIDKLVPRTFNFYLQTWPKLQHIIATMPLGLQTKAKCRLLQITHPFSKIFKTVIVKITKI